VSALAEPAAIASTATAKSKPRARLRQRIRINPFPSTQFADPNAFP